MSTDDGGGITEDGGFEHFAGVYDAGRQTPHRDRVDPDDLIFLIQEEDDKVFSIHSIQVCPEQSGGISRTPDPLLIARHLSFPHQHYPIHRYVGLGCLALLKQG